MTKAELKPLYVDACVRARTKPNASEEAVWYSKLGFADIADLKEAIDAHFTDSHWMPKESELKPLLEQARRSRNRNTRRTTYARWKCSDCGAETGGFIEPSDFHARRCQGIPKNGRSDGNRICGAALTQVYRQDNFTTGNESLLQESRIA